MKAKVLVSVLAVAAMLMSGVTAEAKTVRGHDSRGGMHRMEHRIDNRLHSQRVVMAPRPKIGARIRPLALRSSEGHFVKINGERLWLADGILYRVVRTGHTITYIVVGHL